MSDSDSKPFRKSSSSKIGRPCTSQIKPAVTSIRSSMNTSIVLTEDTDSFIIGNRVWVGGRKPGSIAYIGETQFAPGDWAGVVLDEPIGKNDGSVAGSRYFQCTPRHGIFSRLTRLTLQPLSDDTGSTATSKKRSSNIESASQSLNTSTTSLSSSVFQNRDLKIGDRVIVSSSQGSKTGILRYLGATEFAAGEWCGVELNDPVGKNDGSVANIRYFECPFKHGLFAPVQKVSRSPLSKRSSLCVGRKPSLNSSIRRTNSRESLTSLSSIISTTSSHARGNPTSRRVRQSNFVQSPLQEMLKEKQQEIDILKKEKELERERVTKAAIQADNAERSKIALNQQYYQYRENSERTVLEAESALAKLLEEKKILNAQLDAEKKKCEDLLFRFEEESINREDIQVVNTVRENKIEKLEEQLNQEHERIIQLERDNTKLFELEEELQTLRNENKNLSEIMEAKIRLDNQISKSNNANEELQCIVDEKLQIQESKNLELQNFNQTLDAKIILLKIIGNKNDELFEVMNFKIVKLKEIIIEIENERVKEKISIVAELKQMIQEKDNEIELEIDKINYLESKSDTVHQPNDIQKTPGNPQDVEDLAFNLIFHSELEKRHMKEGKNIITSDKENTQIIRINLEKLNMHLEIEKNKLKEIITAKDSEINELRRSFESNLDNKLAEVAKTSIKLDDKLLKLSLAEQEITELKCQNLNKDGEIKNLIEKTTELQDTINFSEQTKTNLESELKMYESNMKDLQKNLAISDEKIGQINTDKIQLTTGLCSAMSSSANLSENLLEYNKKIESKNEEIIQLKELIFQADILNKSTKQQLDEKNDTIELCNKQIDSLKLEVLFLKQNYEQLTKNLSAAENEFTKLTSRFEEMEYSYQCHISQLEIQIKSLQDELGSLNAKCSSEIEEASVRELNDRYSMKVNNISLLDTDSDKRIENITNDKKALFAKDASIISQSQERLKTCEKKNKITENDKDILNNQNFILKELSESESKQKHLNDIVRNVEEQNKRFQIEDSEKTTIIQKLPQKIEKQPNVTEEHSDERILLLGSENEVSDGINVKQGTIQEIDNIFTNSTYEDQSSTNSEMLKELKIEENDILFPGTDEEINSVQSQCRRLHKYNEKLKFDILMKDSTIKELKNQLQAFKNENTDLLVKKIQFKNVIALTHPPNEKYDDAKMKLKTDSKKSEDKLQEYINKMKDMEQEINELHKNQYHSKEVDRKLRARLDQYEDKADGQHNRLIINKRNFEKTLEYDETYKSQIEFLNSVIVDMQKKNEKLLCKIEVLEMGVPETEADDYSRTTLEKRAAVPRAFCDICDQFDLHDTEECPMQSEDHMSEEASIKLKMPKAKAERPYCENCEMFGHDSTDCDITETY